MLRGFNLKLDFFLLWSTEKQHTNNAKNPIEIHLERSNFHWIQTQHSYNCRKMRKFPWNQHNLRTWMVIFSEWKEQTLSACHLVCIQKDRRMCQMHSLQTDSFDSFAHAHTHICSVNIGGHNRHQKCEVRNFKMYRETPIYGYLMRTFRLIFLYSFLNLQF